MSKPKALMKQGTFSALKITTGMLGISDGTRVVVADLESWFNDGVALAERNRRRLRTLHAMETGSNVVKLRDDV